MMFRRVPRRWKVIGFVVAGLLITGGIAAAVLLYNRQAAVTVPSAIAEKVLFPIYAPTKLPDGYKPVEESFRHDEGVLVFGIKDESGQSISFTEQSTPAGFDFTGFYDQQMSDPQKVDGAPYQSVIGKPKNTTANDRLMMSIRADETWVLVSGGSASKAELELIARHFGRVD